jgi:hypothetical protein
MFTRKEKKKQFIAATNPMIVKFIAANCSLLLASSIHIPPITNKIKFRTPQILRNVAHPV